MNGDGMDKLLAEGVGRNDVATGQAALAILAGIAMMMAGLAAAVVRAHDSKKIEEKTGEDLL